MKKSILFLCCFLVSFCAVAKEQVYSNDYAFQKQLIVTQGTKTLSCQAVRIAPKWFLTAAHCVSMCQNGGCQTRVVLAAGNVWATVHFTGADIFVPKEYYEEKNNLFWDVALLHYSSNIVYEYPDGSAGSAEAFQRELKADEDLAAQWKGALQPKVPYLYVYQDRGVRDMTVNLIVPRWDNGNMSFFVEPEKVLYLGKKRSLWATAGFGVQEGNSGGGVYLSKKGLIGLVSARKPNELTDNLKAHYPAFANNSEFFLFNGFSKKTTFAFIESTLSRFGDRVKKKDLKEELEPVIVGAE